MLKNTQIAILFSLMAVTCQSDANTTVHVCFRYLAVDSVCGTGTFLKDDRLITAFHLQEMADMSSELTVVKSGWNKKASELVRIPDTDILIAKFSEPVANAAGIPICDNVVVGNEVDMVGVLGRWDDDEWVTGKVLEPKEGHVFIHISGEVSRGYSGGIVYDYEGDCYIGLTYGSGEGETLATDLTRYKDAIKEQL
jgi:hypothetical protein